MGSSRLADILERVSGSSTVSGLLIKGVDSSGQDRQIKVTSDGSVVIKITSDFLPDSDDARSIGSSSRRWKGAFFSSDVSLTPSSDPPVPDSRVDSPAVSMTAKRNVGGLVQTFVVDIQARYEGTTDQDKKVYFFFDNSPVFYVNKAGDTFFQGDQIIDGDVTPNVDNSFTLGSSTKRWASTHSFLHYVHDSATIPVSDALIKVNSGVVQVRNSADSAYLPIDVSAVKVAGTERLSADGSASFTSVSVGAGSLTVGLHTPTDTQWSYLASLDQSLTTSDSPTFASVSLTGSLNADVINEKTLGSGVTIDGLLVKDGKLLGTVTVPSVTDTLATLSQSETLSNKTLTNATLNAFTLAGDVTSTSDRTIYLNSSTADTTLFIQNSDVTYKAILDVEGGLNVGGTQVIDASRNLVNVVNLTLSGTITTPNSNNLASLTTAEINQLLNIGTTTISATQWGYLGSLDQSLTTSDTVSFAALQIGGTTVFNSSRELVGSSSIAQNAIVRRTADADGTTTLRDSFQLSFQGAYWDGLVSQNYQMTLKAVIDSTTPTAHLAILNNAGTELFKFHSDGSLEILNQGGGLNPIIKSQSTDRILQVTGSIRASNDLRMYAGTSYQGILKHSNTASRTWTFPDLSGTVALTGASQAVDFGSIAIGGTTVIDSSRNLLPATVKVDNSDVQFSGGNLFGWGTSNGLRITNVASQKTLFYLVPGTDTAPNVALGISSTTDYTTNFRVLEMQHRSDGFYLRQRIAGTVDTFEDVIFDTFDVDTSTQTEYFRLDVTNQVVKYSKPIQVSGSSVRLYEPNYAYAVTFRNNTTNAETVLRLIPNGTPTSTFKARLQVFNTDFTADTTNYELLQVKAESNEYRLESTKGGTGSLRDIVFTTFDGTTRTEYFRLDVTTNQEVKFSKPIRLQGVGGYIEGDNVRLYWNDSTSSNRYFVRYDQTTDQLQFFFAPTTGTGNVWIFGNSSATCNLHVDGNVNANNGSLQVGGTAVIDSSKVLKNITQWDVGNSHLISTSSTDAIKVYRSTSGATKFRLIPNTTGNEAQFQLFATDFEADSTNFAYLLVRYSSATDSIDIDTRGGGTVSTKPLVFKVDGGEYARIDPTNVAWKFSQPVGIGITPVVRLHVATPSTADSSGNVRFATGNMAADSVNVDNIGTNDLKLDHLVRATATASTAKTITNAATLKIDGAPIAGTNVTITNAYALWVDNDLTRLDGGIDIGGTTVIDSSRNLMNVNEIVQDVMDWKASTADYGPSLRLRPNSPSTTSIMSNIELHAKDDLVNYRKLSIRATDTDFRIITGVGGAESTSFDIVFYHQGAEYFRMDVTNQEVSFSKPIQAKSTTISPVFQILSLDSLEASAGTPSLSNYGGSDDGITTWTLGQGDRIRTKSGQITPRGLSKARIRLIVRGFNASATINFYYENADTTAITLFDTVTQTINAAPTEVITAELTGITNKTTRFLIELDTSSSTSTIFIDSVTIEWVN